MIELDRYHKAEEVSKGLYRITENDFVNLYLVTGSEKALLIDLGCGAGDLLAAVRKLTDKPLIVAATHRHPDHIGAAGQFGSYWADPDDLRSIYDSFFGPKASRAMCERAGMDYNPDSDKPCTVLPISDDTVFDLGDRKFVTEKIPGHTAGSRIFIDHDNKVIVSGDACNPYMFLQRPGCLNVEDWLKTAPKLLKYLNEGYSSWYGHGDGVQSAGQVEKIIRYGEKILHLYREGKCSEAFGMYPEDTLPRVFYKTDCITSGTSVPEY